MDKKSKIKTMLAMGLMLSQKPEIDLDYSQTNTNIVYGVPPKTAKTKKSRSKNRAAKKARKQNRKR